MTDFPGENPIPEPLPVRPEPPESSESPEAIGASEEMGPVRRFEDLSLSELLANLVLHPGQTVDNLGQVLRIDRSGEATPLPIYGSPSIVAAPMAPNLTMPHVEVDLDVLTPLIIMFVALIIGSLGSILLVADRTLDSGTLRLPFGGYVLLLGGIIMAGVVALRLKLSAYPRLETEQAAQPFSDAQAFFAVYGLRVVLAGIAIVFTVGAFFLNTGTPLDPASPTQVIFTGSGVFCLILSVLMWIGVFYEDTFNLPTRVQKAVGRAISRLSKPFSVHISWTLIAMVVILLIGANFRFSNLAAYPPDMTSDHVEKVRDTYNIFLGDRPVYLQSSAEREPLHFYFLALLKTLTNQPVDFSLLKIGSGLWGMIEILLAFWAGRAIFGEDNPQFGNLVGVLMAAMIAISYWGTLLSRLGLSSITATLVVTLLLVFLIRAVRHNRRIDWILAGVVLGVGVYAYQSCRLLIILVVLCVPIFLILRNRSWATFRKFLVNLVALLVVAMVIFIPLVHYAVNFPDQFGKGTSGQLPPLDLQGKPPSLSADLSAIVRYITGDSAQNMPGLAFTLGKSLLMFNYRGDSQWFSGDPNSLTPELDVFAGTLFVLGLGVLLARIIKRRDPADWVLLLAIPVTVLSSASAMAAASAEVPSATRGAGALAPVYLIAALGLAVILWEVAHKVPQRSGRYLIYAGVVGVFLLSATSNWSAYFDAAMKNYRDSTLPHHQAGVIAQDFAQTGGSLSNVFIMGYPYWWDKRAVGIEAGDPLWQNGVDEANPPSPDRSVERDRLIAMMRGNMGTPYELRPDRYILIFLNQLDTPMVTVLSKLMPDGWVIHIPVAFNNTKDFLIFISPPLGCDWMRATIGGNIAGVCNGGELQPSDAYPAAQQPSALSTVTPEPSANGTPVPRGH